MAPRTSTDGARRAEHSHAPKFLVTAVAERVARQRTELREMPFERAPERLHRLRRVPVGATERLGDDVVDDAELEEVFRRQAKRLRGARHRIGGLLPVEDRGAAFGRDHRITRVLEHQDAVADPESERSSAASLTDDAD